MALGGGALMGNWVDDMVLSCGRGDILEVRPSEFYRSVFYKSDFYMRYTDSLLVPVTYSDWDGEGHGTWRSVALRDLEASCENRNDAYLSACTFFPKGCGGGRYRATNSLTTASQLCAFVLDFDDVDRLSLSDCLTAYWVYPEFHIPQPTYLVSSGNGVHFYYVLDEPVDVMKRWVRELSHINRWLGEQYQKPKVDFFSQIDYFLIGLDPPDGSTSREGACEPSERFPAHCDDGRRDSPECFLGHCDLHGITQSFRIVGSLSKDCSHTVTAWRVGDTWDIDDLARRSGLSQAFSIDAFDMSRSLQSREWEREREARASAAGGASCGKGWNPGIYEWLASEIIDRTGYYSMYGHRYYQVLCLGICARKDNVPYSDAWKVAQDACEGWNECAGRWGHPKITLSECEKALRSAYKWDPAKVKRVQGRWMSELCGWKWESHQKRRGRSQKEHLARARKIEEYDYPDGSWRYVPPTKERLVRDYASSHPGANHSQIARALGISRPTVIKWLKEGT